MMGGVTQQPMIALRHAIGLELYGEVREGEEGRDDASRIRHHFAGIVVGSANDAIARPLRGHEVERFSVYFLEIPETAAIVGAQPLHHIIECVFCHDEELETEELGQELGAAVLWDSRSAAGFGVGQ